MSVLQSARRGDLAASKATAAPPPPPATFDFYVAANGSDTNPGTISAPLATLANAVSRASSGQKIGLQRGDTFRPGAITINSLNNLTIGAYGTAVPHSDGMTTLNDPILTAGQMVTGWAPYTASGVNPQLLENNTLDTWGPFSGGVWPIHYNTYLAGGAANITQEQTKVHTAGGSAVKFTSDGNTALLEQQTIWALTGGNQYTCSFWSAADNTNGATLQLSIHMYDGDAVGKYLQSDGTTWSTTVYYFTITPGTAYSQYSRTYTPPADGAVLHTWKTNSSQSPIYLDDVSVLNVVPPTPSTNLYRAPLAATTFHCRVNDVARVKGVNQDYLASDEWIQAGGYLYIRNDAGNPNGIGTLTATLGNAGGGAVTEGLITIKPSGASAPSVVRSNQAQAGTTATSCTLTMSQAPAVGNTLLVAIGNASNHTLTPPSGFTVLANVVSGTERLWVGYRTVQSGDGATYTATTSATNDIISMAGLEITGWGGIDQSNFSSTETNSPYHLPSVAPGVANSLALGFVHSNSGGATFSPTVPAGWTQVQWVNGQSYQPLFVFSQTNPALASGLTTVEVASADYPLLFDGSTGNAQHCTVQNLHFRLYNQYAVRFAVGAAFGTADHCWAQSVGWGGINPATGAVTGQNGVIGWGANSNDGLEQYCRYEDCGTDVVYSYKAYRLTSRGSKIFRYLGEFSDAIQVDWDTMGAGIPAYALVDGMYVDRRGKTDAKKGGIILMGDYSQAINSTVISAGGHGVSINGHHTVCRNNVTYLQAHGLYTEGNHTSYDDLTFDRCLSYRNTHGAYIASSTKSNCHLSYLTLANNTLDLFVDAVISGEMHDCILWTPGRTGAEISVGSIVAGSSFTISNCVIGPEIPGVPLISWLGTSYNTLAAWQSATGNGVGCTVADPLFVNAAGDDYHLQAGSAATSKGYYAP